MSDETGEILARAIIDARLDMLTRSGFPLSAEAINSYINSRADDYPFYTSRQDFVEHLPPAVLERVPVEEIEAAMGRDGHILEIFEQVAQAASIVEMVGRGAPLDAVKSRVDSFTPYDLSGAPEVAFIEEARIITGLPENSTEDEVRAAARELSLDPERFSGAVLDRVASQRRHSFQERGGVALFQALKEGREPSEALSELSLPSFAAETVAVEDALNPPSPLVGEQSPELRER